MKKKKQKYLKGACPKKCLRAYFPGFIYNLMKSNNVEFVNMLSKDVGNHVLKVHPHDDAIFVFSTAEQSMYI